LTRLRIRIATSAGKRRRSSSCDTRGKIWHDCTGTSTKKFWYGGESRYSYRPPSNYLKSVFQFRRLCKDNNIDILHSHFSNPGIVRRSAGSQAGVPIIVRTIHSFSFHDYMPAWRRLLLNAFERLISRCNTRLFCLSQTDRETADRLERGVRETVRTFYVSSITFVCRSGLKNHKLFELPLRIRSRIDSSLFKAMPSLRKYA
jgi:hypothetical protein